MQRRAAPLATALELIASPMLVFQPLASPAQFELATRLLAGEPASLSDLSDGAAGRAGCPQFSFAAEPSTGWLSAKPSTPGSKAAHPTLVHGWQHPGCTWRDGTCSLFVDLKILRAASSLPHCRPGESRQSLLGHPELYPGVPLRAAAAGACSAPLAASGPCRPSARPRRQHTRTGLAPPLRKGSPEL